MDTTKWRSVAVRIEDYIILKALCEKSYRAPAAMIGKLVEDYIKLKANKENISSELYKNKLIKYEN